MALEEKNQNSNNTPQTENIFDEFVDSQKVSNEEILSPRDKNLYDYMRIGNMGLTVINVILFLVLIGGVFYNYFQSKEEKIDIWFLRPVCWFMLWSVYNTWQECYSISSFLPDFQWIYDVTEQETSEKLISLMWEVYDIDNFYFSKKVNFLLETTRSQLRPLVILSDFDTIKREFTSSFERSNVICSNIEISQQNTVSMNCDVFSSDWDTAIIDVKNWVRWTLPWWGTSISRASSFLNYIDQHSSGLFRVKQEPSTFSSTFTNEDWPYTQKTSISFTLEYISPQYLSF